MFNVAVQHHCFALGHLMAIAPTDDCLDPIIQLAKVADVTLYPGTSGTAFYLELPENYDDQQAMFGLAAEMGLTCWQYVGLPDGNDQ